MDEANPFVISKTEEDVAAEETALQGLGEGEEATTDLGNVEDLIPLCVKHATGPQISAATFGYDIAQMERRPWDDPGAKQSDYFNYGFNETSWRLYCAMQTEGEESLLAKANEMLRKLKEAGHTEPNEDAARPADTAPFDPNATPGVPPYQGFDRRGGNYRGNMSGMGGADQRMFFKTKLCQRYAEGRCTKGADCTYAHGISELRSAPPTAGGGGGDGGGGGYGLEGLPQHMHGGRMHGGGNYITPQQYGMPPFQPGGGMGPMPMYDGSGGGEGFQMGPKRPRGDAGEY